MRIIFVGMNIIYIYKLIFLPQNVKSCKKVLDQICRIDKIIITINYNYCSTAVHTNKLGSSLFLSINNVVGGYLKYSNREVIKLYIGIYYNN